MALLGIEGFETFGTTVGIAPVGHDRKYTTASPAGHRVRAGRTGGFSVELSSTAHSIQIPVTGTPQEGVIGFGFRVPILGNWLLIIFRSSGSNNTAWSLKSDGSMTIGRGGTVLGTTSTGLISVDTWYYVEIRTKIDNTTGSYEMRLNGTTVLSATGVDTQDSASANFDIIFLRGGGTIWYDDFYVIDILGGKNNDFLGVSSVLAMFPNAAGDSTDFTPDSGSNYARVNENPTDDDTSYVQSSTTGNKDLHNQDNISPSGIIRGIQVNTEVRDTLAGGSSLKTLVKSGTTTDTGPADTIAGTSYEYFTRVVEDDPDISGDWVVSALDAVQVGYEVG